MAENGGKPSTDEEFQDPLENYDPPTYSDPLEEALMERTVAEIEAQPYLTASPGTPVQEAVAKLVGQDVACLMVTEGDALQGIFSDRDVLDKVALEYDAVKDLPLSDVMVSNPVFIYQSDTAAAALGIMAASGYRHVPVLDAKDRVVGILSPHRVAEFVEQHAS